MGQGGNVKYWHINSRSQSLFFHQVWNNLQVEIISLSQQMGKNPDSSLQNEALKDEEAVEEIKNIRIIC